MAKKYVYTLSRLGFFVILVSRLFSLDGAVKGSERETIFDRVVTIPATLILDILQLPPLCNETADLKKGFAAIKDGTLYYEQEGEGVPLVLINGGPGGTHHSFHPYFSRIKDVASIIYYDQRGTGKSSADATGKTYTIKQAVEDLDTLRKVLKIERWAVLGWSYGGFLAQCYALTYPEHVTGLVLVAAGTGPTKVKLKPGRGRMFISQAERDAIRKIYAAFEKGSLNLTQMLYNKYLCGDWKRQHYYKPTADGFIRETLYEWSPAPKFQDLMSNGMDAISLDGKFDDFEVPTLIFEAQWDLTWDTDKAEYIRKNHPHAYYEYFEKSGHQIFADEPEKFFSTLKSFLVKSSTLKIEYKPGNRLTWPEAWSLRKFFSNVWNRLF